MGLLLEGMAAAMENPGGSRARVWPGVTVPQLQGAVRAYMANCGEVDLHAALKERVFCRSGFVIMLTS